MEGQKNAVPLSLCPRQVNFSSFIWSVRIMSYLCKKKTTIYEQRRTSTRAAERSAASRFVLLSEGRSALCAHVPFCQTVPSSERRPHRGSDGVGSPLWQAKHCGGTGRRHDLLRDAAETAQCGTSLIEGTPCRL